MSMPFYVSPAQMVQDKAEFARKGIARGKSIVAMDYKGGIILTAENPSTALSKISEIYDKIAFAGVGKYSEFENLRKAGIRYADTKGYAYSREDVTAKSLANAYSETLSNIFTRELKPLEVEILIAEVGEDNSKNSIYKVQFDGSLSDHQRFAVIGGQAERILVYLKDNFKENLALVKALELSRQSLRIVEESSKDEDNLEVAILDRTLPARKFKRLPPQEIISLIRS